MELERAFDTLGLARGSSAREIETAYRRLCDDFDARIGRVTSLALRDRYAAARAELEAARAAALQAADGQPPTPVPEDPGRRAWAVLGLAIGASPLEVASAYVSLCEELDREVESAPTEALRRRCLEARAEIDAAYQLCAAAPIEGESGAGPESSGYETQVAEAAFEAREPEGRDPASAPVIAIHEPDPAPSRRRRKRPLRRVMTAAATLLLAAGATVGVGLSQDARWTQKLKRYLPLPPAQALVEAQSAAEYLRRRVAEERTDIQQRAERSSARVARLQSEALAIGQNGPEERGRALVALEQAQARTALAKHLHELTERHVFSSRALAEAYGHMELGAELAAKAKTDRAVSAYAEARAQLEATLAGLDEAERALGARTEALDARDAWIALAASAGLEPGAPVLEGGERLQESDALLEEGDFAAATPKLRMASQHFRTALDDGQRILAGRREAFESERPSSGSRGRSLRREATLGASLPPVSAAERAEVKLVAVPAGSFLYGCNSGVDRDCSSSEAEGANAQVAAFRIDRTEVRVSEYRHCVDAGVCKPPPAERGCNWDEPGRGDHPVNCIDWDQAATYCNWVGKRLPTEQEWEKAARGTDGRTYPWGNERASCDVAVMSVDAGTGCGAASTAPVGSRDGGRSPYGIFDMAGNVLEWTVSLHESGAGARVLRGGSWQNDARSMRSSHREGARPNLRHESVGFRCAQGAVIADTRPRN